MSCLLSCLFYIFLFILIVGLLLKIYVTLTTGKHKITKSLIGKVVIITGGTAGIGKETVHELASHGATIHVLARDLTKAQRVIEEIKESTRNNDVHIHQVDLSNFSTIRAFAKKFLETKSPIHILINNAGLATKTKRITIDGNEETTQANHLGHFLLTNLLLDRIIQSGPSRIINLSSMAHRFVKPEQFNVFDINFEKGSKNKWIEFKAYCWSKLLNILFTRELARRLRRTNVTVNSVHPGAVRTELIREQSWKSPLVLSHWIFGLFYKSSLEGAQTTLYLATSDQVENVSGHYFADCKPSNISLLAADDQLAADLWKESERLTGLVEK